MLINNQNSFTAWLPLPLIRCLRLFVFKIFDGRLPKAVRLLSNLRLATLLYFGSRLRHFYHTKSYI